jgi:AbiU2
MTSKTDSIEAIAREAFQTGMEILQLVELMERQNTGRINGNISDSGAGRAGITVRNAMITRLVILVAGAFAPTRAGDRHLKKGFEDMADPNLRSLLKMDTQAFSRAEALWNKLKTDPRHDVIKHFRDKSTAHLADQKPGVPPPQYGQMFDFAKEVATTMEQFAIGVGVTTEVLNDTADWRIDSSQKFWEPWEYLRK